MPDVSIVTSAYNCETTIRESLESVLNQAGVELEVIVIDDGSSDGTPEILRDLAAEDPRVRVFQQANAGLTRALMRGCALASSPYIARHDTDDISLPNRLVQLKKFLDSEPRLSFVSSSAFVIGPRKELLIEHIRTRVPEEATEALIHGREGPPGHGSVMFRRDAYQKAGGYRACFRYAQDWDLWLRLVEVGLLGYIHAPLYAYRVEENSISAKRKSQQNHLVDIAIACYRSRSSGKDETKWLVEAERVSRLDEVSAPGSQESHAYFIGKCLLDRRDRRAVGYLGRCILDSPYKWRNWAALLAAALLCYRKPRVLSTVSSRNER
jgi:glycosyltransferase involved in cell wall biosynthesis